jgi:hypothetical protein
VPPLRQTLNLFARHYAVALQRATRLRLGGALALPPEPDAAMLQASEVHLPGVGWLLGLAAGLSFALVALTLRGNPWAPAAAAVACIMVTSFLTRALPERALAADTDPLVLYIVTAGKITLVAAIAARSEAGVIAALFAAQAVSRASTLLVGLRSGLLLRGGDGRALKTGAQRRSGGSSRVTSAGPEGCEAITAVRPRTDSSHRPSSSGVPTRYGLAGLPSTEMTAAPAPERSPATTPTSWNRLARLATGSAAGPAAGVLPSRRAMATGSAVATCRGPAMGAVTGGGPPPSLSAQ